MKYSLVNGINLLKEGRDKKQYSLKENEDNWMQVQSGRSRNFKCED